MALSIQNYGLDTSVFVRLLTGHPESEFIRTVRALEGIYKSSPTTELVVSNQVIGEAYVTLQIHYKVSKSDAREAILHLLESSFLSPLNGKPVMEILNSTGGAGLMDQLIAEDYRHQGMSILTNDRRMGKLEGARLL